MLKNKKLSASLCKYYKCFCNMVKLKIIPHQSNDYVSVVTRLITQSLNLYLLSGLFFVNNKAS